MKKLLAIILTILMIVTMIPFTPVAFAAEGDTRTIYVDWNFGWHAGNFQKMFFDSMGNKLPYEFESIEDNFDLYRISVDAASYWFDFSNNGIHEGAIPEKVDYYEAATKTWYCSHQMGTSGEQTCKGYLCEICDEFYGEADTDAHDWSNCDGSCVICNIECDHETYTNEVCDICGWICDHLSVNVSEKNCDYCGRDIDSAEITVGETVSVNDITVYEFTPEYSGTYIVSSSIAEEYSDPCAELYKDDVYIGTYDDCYDENDEIIDYDFNFTYNYEAGQNYYLVVSDLSAIYGFTVDVECETHNWSEGKCLACGTVCDHAEQTGAACEVCGATLHSCDFSGEWKHDSEKHWKECSCSEISAEAEHTFTDGKCDCGYECPHDDTYNNIIRPVQNADGTWGKGAVETVCNICTKVTATKEVERADYTAADAAVAELKELIETEDLLDAMKNIYTKRLNISLSIIGDDKIESEQNLIDDITQGVNKSIDEIKEGLKDGTMVKADFTYMGSLLDEVRSLTDNNPDNVLIPSMVEIYIVCNNIYNAFANNSSLSQSYYDEKIKEAGFEAQLEALIEAIKDGTALKADYTAIDEAIAEIEEKLADENVTDEAKAGLEEIKSQLEEKKADGNTSAADLAELEKALEDYETELDAGIKDGSAVKVDGLKEIVNINDKLNNELAEKYGEEALAEIAEKIDEKFADKFDELYERAEGLTGTVAENKDALDEIESEMKAIFAEAENCLNGTHNGLKFEVTEDAECGKNAVESAVCTLCGETVTRVVENSALTHSFTKYEVTEEAKCGVAGKKVALCDNGCGETDEKAIEALRHSFTKYEVTEEAKCGVAGKEVATCDNGCGETDEKAIAALEHLFIDYIYNEDATCTADGTKTAICLNGCGETNTVTAEGTMLDHADEDGDKICDNCEAEIASCVCGKEHESLRDILVCFVMSILSMIFRKILST